MTCKLCGGESGKYILCFKCNKLKEEGKAAKCADCGGWYYVDKGCTCQGTASPKIAPKSTPINGEGGCIVCGEKAPNGLLCRECYYEMRDFKDSFDKNAKSFDMKDYYFNLRSNIYRMKTFDYVKSNCNKLMAIANFVSELHHDASLTDRVATDIKDIIETKKPKKEETVKPSEQILEKDSHKEELLRTKDGHYVKSDPERQIDDIFYDLRIVHCYERKVPIDADEQAVKCDWFIPVQDDRHGIYVEYWGMNTKEYLQNKERKRKAYRENNLPLIEIEKDDYRDSQGLTDRLEQEINKLAKEYYRIERYLR